MTDAIDRSDWTEPRVRLSVLGLAAATGVGIGVLHDAVLGVLAALGLVFVGLIFVVPRIGLMAFVVIHFFTLSSITERSAPGLPGIGDIVGGVLLVVIVARYLVLGERPSLPPTIVGLMSAYAALGFASVWIARDPAQAMTGAIDLVEHTIVVLIIVSQIREVRDLRWAVYALVMVGAIVVGAGLVQYGTGTFANSYGGLAVGVRQFVVDDAGAQYAFRLAGPIGLPNVFGQRLATLVPLVAGIALVGRVFVTRVAAWIVVAGLAVAIVLTFSRGAFIGLAVGFVLILALARLKVTTMLVLAAIGLAVVAVMPTSYTARLSILSDAVSSGGDQFADQSIRGRTGEVIAGLEMFLDHPIVGVGPGNYESHYLDYSRDIAIDPRREERQAHNLFVEVAAERGIVGLSLFTAIVLYAFASLRNAWWSAARSEDRVLAASLGVAITTFMVCGLFLHLVFSSGFWILVGLSVAAGRLRYAAQVPRAEVHL